jgi:hypothetical protein
MRASPCRPDSDFRLQLGSGQTGGRRMPPLCPCARACHWGATTKDDADELGGRERLRWSSQMDTAVRWGLMSLVERRMG